VFKELVFSIDPWIQRGRIRVRWDKFTAVLAKRTDHLPDSDSWRQESTMESIENGRRKIIFEMQGAWNRHHHVGNAIYGVKETINNTIFELLQARRGLVFLIREI
jgi:hypothetical protein